MTSSKARKQNRPNSLKNFIGKTAIWIASKFCPEVLDAFIKEVAEEIASKAVARVLDRQGLLHCEICLKRAPLRNVGDLKACPEHVEELTARVFGKRVAV